MQKDLILRRIVALVLLYALAIPCHAGSGGPDVFGYTWKDSFEPEVTYQWVDIVNRAGAVQVTNQGDDDYTASIPLGFDFRYYWIDFPSVRIGTNGWLSFDQGFSNNAWCFQNMPSNQNPGTNNTLAPLLSDLTFLSGYSNYPNPGELWYWTNYQDSFVVTFVNLPWWKDDTSGTQPPDWIGQNTFQVILNASDTTVTFQYRDLSQAAFVDRPDCPTEIVVGIENSTGQIGLQAWLEAVPPDSYAIRFYYPEPSQDTFKVRDASAVWSMNVEGKGGFFLAGDTLAIQGLVTNAGNTLIDTPVVVEARLLNESLATFWVQRDTLDSLAASVPLPVQFANGPQLSQTGQFFANIEVRQAGDLNQYNNRADCEIDVVPALDSSIVLRYAYNTVSGTSISWPSGGNGVGMYIDFPYYPYRITGIEVYIIGNDSDTLTPLPSGFLVEVQADDAAMGAPGSVLGSVPVSSFDAKDGWNYLPLNDAPVISEGGIYVSWIQGGTGIGLGTQRPGPKSRQTWEIFSGSWAPYRFAVQEDLMIRVHVDRFWVNVDPASLADHAKIGIAPNPGQGRFVVTMEQTRPGPVQITVRDLHGRTMVNEKFAGKMGMRNFEIDMGKVAGGFYWLEILQGDKRYLKKLAIAH